MSTSTQRLALICPATQLISNFSGLPLYYTLRKLHPSSISTYSLASHTATDLFQHPKYSSQSTLLLSIHSLSLQLLLSSLTFIFPSFWTTFSQWWLKQSRTSLSAISLYPMKLKRSFKFTTWALTTICTKKSIQRGMKQLISVVLYFTSMKTFATLCQSCAATTITTICVAWWQCTSIVTWA